MYAVAFSFGGHPADLYEDELALDNDDRWADDPACSRDNRWMHRPTTAACCLPSGPPAPRSVPGPDQLQRHRPVDRRQHRRPRRAAPTRARALHHRRTRHQHGPDPAGALVLPVAVRQLNPSATRPRGTPGRWTAQAGSPRSASGGLRWMGKTNPPGLASTDLPWATADCAAAPCWATLPLRLVSKWLNTVNCRHYEYH